MRLIDVLVKIDSKSLATPDDLADFMKKHRPGVAPSLRIALAAI